MNPAEAQTFEVKWGHKSFTVQADSMAELRAALNPLLGAWDFPFQAAFDLGTVQIGDVTVRKVAQ